MLAECDLLEKNDARAKTLSGGQMRKLQLAISFVGGSKVCCIDEASSGLVSDIQLSLLLSSDLNRIPSLDGTSGTSSRKDTLDALFLSQLISSMR